MQEEGREIILSYGGFDEEGDREQFMQAMYAVETHHLLYFISRPAIFEDEPYEHLHYHFFLFFASGQVILLLAENSTLPPEIVVEVQATFRKMFTPAF